MCAVQHKGVSAPALAATALLEGIARGCGAAEPGMQGEDRAVADQVTFRVLDADAAASHSTRERKGLISVPSPNPQIVSPFVRLVWAPRNPLTFDPEIVGPERPTRPIRLKTSKDSRAARSRDVFRPVHVGRYSDGLDP